MIIRKNAKNLKIYCQKCKNQNLKNKYKYLQIQFCSFYMFFVKINLQNCKKLNSFFKKIQLLFMKISGIDVATLPTVICERMNNNENNFKFNNYNFF